MGIGRVRPPVPQDGGSAGLVSRDGKFIKAFGVHANGRRVHRDRTVWRSIRRAGCSWRIARTIGSDLRQEHERGRRMAAFRSAQQRLDLEGRQLVVSDSESNQRIGGQTMRPKAAATRFGTRVGKTAFGSAARATARSSTSSRGTRPEGLAADDVGNIFGGLTGGCDASPSGGCLQKFVRKSAGAKP